MRDAFGEALAVLGEMRDDFVVVDADNAPATRTQRFRERFPERFVNVGCAEQNLVGVATGIALLDVPVVASTFAVFLVGRGFEQIRNSVCAAKAPVTLVGTHAGISVGRDGASHTATEDVALMRSLPGMRVLVPSSAAMVLPLLASAIESRAPNYVRISRHDAPPIEPWDSDTGRIGRSRLLRTGPDVAVLATGLMVSRALEAARELDGLGIRSSVLDLFCVEPLDEQAVLRLAEECRCFVVAEEHGQAGGAGEAVASLLCRRRPAVLEHVAVPRQFVPSGDPDRLMDAFGLSVQDIVQAARRAVARTA
jgi:transketolase